VAAEWDGHLRELSHTQHCRSRGFSFRVAGSLSLLGWKDICGKLKPGILDAFLFFFFFFFWSFLTFLGLLPTAYGGSQVRGLIGAVATGLHQSHSNAGSETRLQPTPQLTATPDP